MQKRRGSTLIEVSIHSLLLLLVLVMAYAFYEFGARYLDKTRTQAGLQQSAGLAYPSLVRDLLEAQSGSITSFSAPAGVVMLSARDGQGKFCYEPTSGYPIWQRYVGYYLDNDPEAPGDPEVRALVRAEVVGRGGLPSNNPQSPTVAGVTPQYVRTNGVNRKLVVHGLRGFDVYSRDAAEAKIYPVPLTNPVWVDLEFRNHSTGSKPNSMLTRLTVKARN